MGADGKPRPDSRKEGVFMRVLFQGDSITDSGRNYSDPHDLGWGYASYAAEEIRKRFPEREFEFVDLGISGNQTKDLVARLQSDFIDVQPDVVSVLIGVNDVWHHAEDRSWIPAEVFEERFRRVLTALRQETHAKIMVIEPFLFPTEDKLFFREDLDPKIQIERRVARELSDVYMPLDGLLASALVGREIADFSDDGVHPNAGGARYIGKLYADYIAPLIEQL